METATNDQRPRPDSDVRSQVARLLSGNGGHRQRGTVEVAGEVVEYDLLIFDTRTTEQIEEDDRRGIPGGNVIVVLPGHGQTVSGSKKLAATAALMSKAKVAWCVNIIPTRGGDPTEAAALAEIMRGTFSAMFLAKLGPDTPPQPEKQYTLVGWSHGGGESIRTAGMAPELFPQLVGLCPTSMVDRQPLEFVGSFFLEALRVAGNAMRKGDWTSLQDALRVGGNMIVGMARDLWKSKSLKRLINDILWATRKVPGSAFDYPGEIVILFGEQDTVIRWRDAFPDCEHPREIPERLPAYQKSNFPRASRLEVGVIEADHLGPEAYAPAFVRPALSWLGQLDERAFGGTD